MKLYLNRNFLKDLYYFPINQEYLLRLINDLHNKHFFVNIFYFYFLYYAY
jgi:hypothetical protein